jgi:hypothetical protein
VFEDLLRRPKQGFTGSRHAKDKRNACGDGMCGGMGGRWSKGRLSIAFAIHAITSNYVSVALANPVTKEHTWKKPTKGECKLNIDASFFKMIFGKRLRAMLVL